MCSMASIFSSLPAFKIDQRLKDEGPSSLKVWKRDNGIDYLLWLRLTVPVVYRQCERTLFKEETWEVRAFREWQQWIWKLLDGGGEMGSEQNRDLVRRWQILFLSFQFCSSQCAHPEAPSHARLMLHSPIHYSHYTTGLKVEWIGSLWPVSLKKQSQTHTKKQNE